jgi:protein-S-isoprenylcysteine O-methyltransferase Ste14
LQTFLNTVGWLACAVYSTIPAFWLLIHPRADSWRSGSTSPYRILLPLWVAMWIFVALITFRGRNLHFYQNNLIRIPAIALLCVGVILYKLAHHKFTLAQLAGLPELLPGREHQALATTGIRAHIRHPVYLAHLCEMLAWSLGTGLVVCWALTAFASVIGAIMIRAEDAELESRFGDEYRRYRANVGALIPKLK